MYYGMIKKVDVADGPGVRVSLFVSGCSHHCPGCFQPETWNPDYGSLYTKDVEDEIIRLLEPDYITGLTLLGGEPFEPYNQRELLPLLRRVKRELPDKTIWAYSGYVYEELAGTSEGSGRARCEVTDDILQLLDVLVDGEFKEDLKNLSLSFRGSENQRLIDVKKTRGCGRIQLLPYM